MHKIGRSCLFGLTLIALTPAAWADNFGFTGGVVDYTVAATGTYSFSVSGAQGGGAYLDDGGLGAFLSGDVYLTAGTELGIVVGGQGVNGNFGSQYGGGGGGGSFVYIVGATNPLFVAGGGGGAGYYATNGDDAQITTFGSAGQGDQGGAAGTSGSGGLGGFDPTTGYVTNGAGGGGWLGNGGDGLGDGPSAPYGSGLGGVGAFSFLGGAGDGGDGDAGQFANGGFGGGGGGGYQGGGGGGGYSGGGGGDGYESGGGGGGGSYVDGAVLNAVLQSSSQSGDGFVTVTADSVVVSSTPEPASFVLLGTGLLIVGFRRRK